MIDLTPEQAAPRIVSMLAAHESRTLEFKRMGDNKIVRPSVWDEAGRWLDRSR